MKIRILFLRKSGINYGGKNYVEIKYLFLQYVLFQNYNGKNMSKITTKRHIIQIMQVNVKNAQKHSVFAFCILIEIGGSVSLERKILSDKRGHNLLVPRNRTSFYCTEHIFMKVVCSNFITKHCLDNYLKELLGFQSRVSVNC